MTSEEGEKEKLGSLSNTQPMNQHRKSSELSKEKLRESDTAPLLRNQDQEWSNDFTLLILDVY